MDAGTIMNMNQIDIRNLKTYFDTPEGEVKAVDGVDLTIGENETLGLMGETGCGKSVLALSIVRLLPPSAVVNGEVMYNGRDLLRLSEEEMRKIRGKEIALMLQNPATSLNPVISVVEQVSESIRLHGELNRRQAGERALDLLDSLGIPPGRASEYPHQFSSGMRQRAVIAVAMASQPRVLLADEPTSGLDSPVKAQILQILDGLRQSAPLSILLITHDLDVAAILSKRIAVMYAGEIVELAEKEQLFSAPLHPYTRGLLNSLPHRGFKPVAGLSPSLIDLPSGCRFHPRCPEAVKRCSTEEPDIAEVKENHLVRCFLYD